MCTHNFRCKCGLDEFIFEPPHGKTSNVFLTGPTQTELYSHRRWLEVGYFVFRKETNCTIRIAKIKALISFAVTAKLICAFVFAYVNCRFSLDAAHFNKFLYCCVTE